MTLAELPEGVTRSELAKLCGRARQTVYEWERAGLIPAGVRVSGRETVFSRAAVIAALDLAEAAR